MSLGTNSSVYRAQTENLFSYRNSGRKSGRALLKQNTSPLREDAKLFDHNSKQKKKKEIWREMLTFRQRFFFKDNWIRELCGFSIKRLRKLSAVGDHLLWPSWPCLLSGLAPPDETSEGLSAPGDGRAELQRTLSQIRLKSWDDSTEETAADAPTLHFHTEQSNEWGAGAAL